MKGPSGKSRYRIERRWKCPRCGKELATPGVVVVQPCPACSKDGTAVLMSLIEPRRLRNPFPFGSSYADG